HSPASSARTSSRSPWRCAQTRSVIAPPQPVSSSQRGALLSTSAKSSSAAAAAIRGGVSSPVMPSNQDGGTGGDVSLAGACSFIGIRHASVISLGKAGKGQVLLAICFAYSAVDLENVVRGNDVTIGPAEEDFEAQHALGGVAVEVAITSRRSFARGQH